MPADDPFTEAVTAVRRAAIGDQEESRLRIFVLQAWNHGIVVLAARVQRSGADQFMQRRFDDMFQLRVVRAVPDQLIVEPRDLIPRERVLFEFVLINLVGSLQESDRIVRTEVSRRQSERPMGESFSARVWVGDIPCPPRVVFFGNRARSRNNRTTDFGRGVAITQLEIKQADSAAQLFADLPAAGIQRQNYIGQTAGQAGPLVRGGD